MSCPRNPRGLGASCDFSAQAIRLQEGAGRASLRAEGSTKRIRKGAQEQAKSICVEEASEQVAVWMEERGDVFFMSFETLMMDLRCPLFLFSYTLPTKGGVLDG